MKRFVAGLLCLCFVCLLFTGCGQQDVYVPTGDALEFEENYTGPTIEATVPEQPQELSLTYYPNISMNPYICTDFTNRALFSLLYQGLFAVDREYQVTPVLCKNYRVSNDMRIYTFYPENATFSDGSVLTAQDVLDSLLAAKESKLYSGRFLRVSEFRLSDDGKGVTVLLNTPYENFPILLDVPILRSEDVAQAYPLGTGPYIFRNTVNSSSLQRRANWWCDAEMAITADTIALIHAESATQIRDNFQFGDLGIVCADPGSDRYADYRSDFELWDCENGIFLYLVCSEYSKVFSDPELRAALTYALDREQLADEFYRGFAQAASLPASPSSPYYNRNLASRYDYDKEKFAQAVEAADIGDKTITLLVNSEDSLRTRVARAICDMLRDGGLTVELKDLSGEAYEYNLNAWNFDLYLGQTVLSPNMDLSQFFYQYGTLRQGGISDSSAYALCQQALENHGNYYTLHQTVMDNGLLCPVLFRSYAVYATRGLMTGLAPARDNVFYYSTGRSMEDALLTE